MSGPPPEGGEQVRVLEWARDGALGGMGANLAALAAVLALGSVMDGVDSVVQILTDRRFYGALAVVVGAGTVFGAAAGAGGAALWRATAGRWLLLLPWGFPVGFVAGVSEAVLLNVLVFEGMTLSMVAFVAGAGGACALGLGWPLYLVLRVGGRPGVGAVVVVPMLAIGSVLAPLTVALWWERP